MTNKYLSPQEYNQNQFEAERKSGIGGSDAPVVVGESPWKTRRQLWAEKRGLIEADVMLNKDMQRGLVLEEHALAEYKRDTGHEILSAPVPLLRHVKHDFMIGHLDAMALDEDRGRVVVEVKCPRSVTFRKYATEGVPLNYLIQIQHYLEVADLEYADFTAFNSDAWDLLVIPIKRDREVGQMLIKEESDFWQCVVSGELPDERRIAAALPKAEKVIGDCKMLPLEELPPAEKELWMDRLVQYQYARDAAEQAEKDVDNIKAELIQMMGGFELARGFNVALYHTMVAGRTKFDEIAFKSAHPEIDLDKFKVRGESSRRFRTYFLKGGMTNE